MAMFAICVTSCGNGGSITPTSKKVNGPLGKYFEIVERDYKIIDDKLSVEFKRIAEGGPKDTSWDTHPKFIVELQDEDGNVLSTKSTDVIFSEDQLGTVFSLGVDETSSITFSIDIKEGVAKFKVSSKWDGDDGIVNMSKGNGCETAGSLESFFSMLSTERLSNEDLERFTPEELRVLRNALYAKHGYIFKDQSLGEYFSQFDWYIGITKDQGVAYKEFNVIEKSNLTIIQDMETHGTTFNGRKPSSGYEISDNNGDVNIDKYLDAYEKYVDKYISYVQKAAKGDMSAFSEYPTLMKQAQECSEKLQKVKGEMTSVQCARFNKITMKMANTAQQMQ